MSQPAAKEWKGPMDGPPPGLIDRLKERKRRGTRLRRPVRRIKIRDSSVAFGGGEQ